MNNNYNQLLKELSRGRTAPSTETPEKTNWKEAIDEVVTKVWERYLTWRATDHTVAEWQAVWSTFDAMDAAESKQDIEGHRDAARGAWYLLASQKEKQPMTRKLPPARDDDEIGGES